MLALFLKYLLVRQEKNYLNLCLIENRRFFLRKLAKIAEMNCHNICFSENRRKLLKLMMITLAPDSPEVDGRSDLRFARQQRPGQRTASCGSGNET
jgi:hypothetical protein